MSDHLPILSIGMPVYNGEDYLPEALDSILNQTLTDFELIISDNGSIDKTPEIIKEYSSKDERINFHRFDRNSGASKNYNYVFRQSKGKYFKWAAHDDICAPTYMEKCIETLNKNESVILCYSLTTKIDNQGEKIELYGDDLNLDDLNPARRFKKYLFRKKGLCNPVFGVIRSDVLRKTSLIGNYNGSDIILLGHLSLLGKFYEIPDYLFFRRMHKNASASSNPNPGDLAAWYDPNKKAKMILPNWRRYYEFIKIILNMNMKYSDQLHCLIVMQKWFICRRKSLKNDLKSIFNS